MAYIAQTDLQNRLGIPTVLALFDDTGTGTINASAMTSVLGGSSVRVDSYLARTYKGTLPLPGPTYPAMVVEASLEWATYLSFRRKPEYVAAYYGKAGLLELQKNAEDFCERLADAELRLPDATTITPQNVGALTYDNSNRLIIDSANGTDNQGDF